MFIRKCNLEALLKEAREEGAKGEYQKGLACGYGLGMHLYDTERRNKGVIGGSRMLQDIREIMARKGL